MEKDYRLFVKNLPLNIDDSGVRKIFGKLVTIKKIDLKEKKDLSNKINKFAFVNVTTTDKGLHQCFEQLNGERFDGFEISVELAKESFLERLKREREESQQIKEPPKDFDFIKPLTFDSTISTKSKHKKFDDVDFSSKEFEVEKVKKKRKQSLEIDHADNFVVESFEVSSFVQSFENVEHITNDFEQPCNSVKTEKKKYINNLDADNTEISNVHKNKKTRQANEFNNNKPKRPIPEKPVSKSEMKRLMSVKEKKKVFKAQEKVIRNALKSVDDVKLNKKILFDDDTDFENLSEITQQSSKKKNALFESDNEDEEDFGWNEDELEVKASTKKKLLKMQTSIGNDKRFALDERFVDDDEEETVKESNSTEPNDDANFDEKKWQLGILEQVLGKPVKAPTATSSDTVQKKKQMIRYDPTANDHEKYEVAVEKPKEEKSKKKKKKKITEEVQEEAPLPTSKEIYYDVSEKLADSFKPAEGFSLLKNLGRDEVAAKRETEPVKEVERNEGGFKFSFSSKNPFKYDSSDDEGENEKDGDDYTFKLKANKASEDDDRLFTPLGDSRIEELNKFFNTPAKVDEEAFKRRRRELKKIVRTKIRNNLKKATPWNKKKVWKQKKKQR